ncbi:MAG: phospho-N-acetylmuramoyl-pentapeptide-transferase [Christensenellales bacterium]
MNAVLAALLALILMLLGMPGLIVYLKKLKFGQTIYDLGPQAHLSKQGTPNMGGLLIAGASLLAALLFVLPEGLGAGALPMMLCALGALAIGFTDDFIKDVRKHHEGLKPGGKIIGQVLLGILFSLYCRLTLGAEIYLPFSGAMWDLGPFYLPLMTILVIFMTNSANLQDGVDGIMASVSLIGGLAFGLIALLLARDADALQARAAAYLCFTLCGACLGFLKFNRHPARVMMGDTGSMFIGGLVVAVAMQLRLQLWLIPICFTMILSSVSVIMQRVYYKISHGKRIFKMSPIHHHFELSGMSENQVVLMYAAVTFALSAMAVLAALPLL